MLAGTGALIAMELVAPCPPGGPLSFGQCGALEPIAATVVGLAAILYVGGLTAVLLWVGRLRARRLADPRASRDWYLLAATLGVPVTLLLAFTLVSALR